MKRYFYVPKDKDIEDFLDIARDNGCSEIVHGDSDLVNDLITNVDEEQVVMIPEYRMIYMEKSAYEQGEDVKIIFMDEWLKDTKYIMVNCVISKIDMYDPSKIEEFISIPMMYDEEFCFGAKFIPEEYGEFVIDIVCVFDDESQKKIMSKEFIVYKKEESGGSNGKFRFEV